MALRTLRQCIARLEEPEAARPEGAWLRTLQSIPSPLVILTAVWAIFTCAWFAAAWWSYNPADGVTFAQQVTLAVGIQNVLVLFVSPLLLQASRAAARHPHPICCI